LIIHCPDIHTLVDAIVVRQAVQHSPGLDEVEIDHLTGDIRLVTSNQDGGTDVRIKISNAGFPPDSVEAHLLPHGPPVSDGRDRIL
jgi:hypothetical protein